MFLGHYRSVDVESKTVPGQPTPLLHLEDSDTGKTFCGKKPMSISQKIFIMAWDCQICTRHAINKIKKLKIKK